MLNGAFVGYRTLFVPERLREHLLLDAAVFVFLGDLLNLFEQFLVQKNWVKTKILELLVLDVQLVLCRLLSWIRNVA